MLPELVTLRKGKDSARVLWEGPGFINKQCTLRVNAVLALGPRGMQWGGYRLSCCFHCDFSQYRHLPWLCVPQVNPGNLKAG